MKDNRVRNLVRCIRNDMYGFTNDEVYQVVSMFYSEGDSYILKGHMFYNRVDDDEESYRCHDSCCKEKLQVK